MASEVSLYRLRYFKLSLKQNLSNQKKTLFPFSMYVVTFHSDIVTVSIKFK